MEIIDRKQFTDLKHVYFMQIIDGAVFVYPTDTIYGLGCDATNSAAVKKLRDIKHRTTQSFSVIAPSKEWIKNNCHVSKDAERYLDKLPGAYTLILRLKNKHCIAKEVSTTDTLGVRIPEHWISDAVKEMNRPIVTTSVNIAGESPVHDIKQIRNEIAQKIDFAIDEGKLSNFPSKIIDLTGKEPKQLR
ncbi:MAG: threonylcarbamoyl-AMP synthase [Nanoarchaeota archaeon]|nr:threonylcarbamoyl-AMP synthase [Nanoarchaeota archaeon]